MFKFLSYLSKNYLTIWISVVVGFVLLIGLLDSLANGSDIMTGDGKFSDTFRYMFYRAPVIFDRIFVFTLNLAALLVYIRLIRNHELVALLGFGISVPKQVSLLAPIVILCSVASITFINYAMPPAVRALQAWGIGEYKIKNISDNNPLWLEDGNHIIRAAGRPGMNQLSRLQIFERNDDGNLQNALWVKNANYDGEGWQLQSVELLEIEGADGERRKAKSDLTERRWETIHTPATIARLAAEPRDLSLRDMRNFKEKGNSGSKPRFAYAFWFLHRLTRPIAALVLLLCAIPIMQRTGRADNGDMALLAGLALGFIFLIIDGAMATFATTGGMAVNLAIAIPLVMFTLFGGFLCLRTESLGQRSA